MSGPRPNPTPSVAATLDRDRFPNLAAWYDWDREEHIRHAMKAGMTREEAERHDADERHEG
jgi:hypothetical protein